MLVWAVLVTMLVPELIFAQSDAGSWSSPLNLFETEGRASEAEIVADPFGAVHVFWAYGAPNAEDEGWAQAIYYARLQDGAWSEPIDILVSPDDRIARMPGVVVDGDGFLHAVWSGGNALFYSRAFAPEAASAAKWTAPDAITSGVSALEPAIAAGAGGVLYAVWTQARSGLMFARSDDRGATWSTPQVIYPAENNNELARWGRIAVDEAGRLHVVLTYTVNDPEARYGRTDANLLYYLRSDDQGATWSEPFLVTPEPDFGEINVATFGEDTVHLVWNGRAGRHGRYHRWSQDGGRTWSDTEEVIAPAPANPIGDGGLTGFPALAIDATGALHMVSATGGGDYYLRWEGGNWSSPVLISPGLDGSGVTRTTDSLEQPSIAISQGNQLHTVFHDGFERIWHTSRPIAAPYQPPQPTPMPDAVPSSTPIATPDVLVTVNPTVQPTPPATFQAAPPINNPSYLPILVAVLPAVLLVGLVVVVVGMRRRR